MHIGCLRCTVENISYRIEGCPSEEENSKQHDGIVLRPLCRATCMLEISHFTAILLSRAAWRRGWESGPCGWRYMPASFLLFRSSLCSVVVGSIQPQPTLPAITSQTPDSESGDSDYAALGGIDVADFDCTGIGLSFAPLDLPASCPVSEAEWIRAQPTRGLRGDRRPPLRQLTALSVEANSKATKFARAHHSCAGHLWQTLLHSSLHLRP